MTKLCVVAFKPLLCFPAVVPSFNNEVNFLEPVLPDIPTEYPPSPLFCGRVPSVHRTAPHIPDPVGINLWAGFGIRHEWIIRRDAVRFSIGASSIHINPQHFPQQCTPKEKAEKETPA